MEVKELKTGYKVTKDNSTVYVNRSAIYDFNDELISLLTFGELIDFYTFHCGIPSDLNKYLVRKIELYDKSTNVNSFIYNGNSHWLDKSQRAGIARCLDSSDEDFTLILGEEWVQLPKDSVKQFLANLDLYAHKCYLVTQSHLKQAKQLTTLQEFKEFDYTADYPEKVILSI